MISTLSKEIWARRNFRGSVAYLNSKCSHPPNSATAKRLAALVDLVRSDYDLQKVKTETLETLKEVRDAIDKGESKEEEA